MAEPKSLSIGCVSLNTDSGFCHLIALHLRSTILYDSRQMSAVIKNACLEAFTSSAFTGTGSVGRRAKLVARCPVRSPNVSGRYFVDAIV